MKLARILALLLKYCYVTLNSVDRMLDVLFWPVVNLFIWGFTSVFVDRFASGAGFVGLFIGGLILWSFFDRAQKDVSIYILEDFWDRAVYNLYVTPITEGEIFVAVALFGLLRSLLSFVILAALAALAYAFNIVSIGWLMLAAFIIPLLLYGWAFGILIAGLIFRLGPRISVFTWSLPFLLQPISAIFYPVDVLPRALQWLAYAFPPAHIFEGFRAALKGNFAVGSFGWALGLSIAYFALFYLVFLWCVGRSKQTGFLAKQ